MRWCHRSSAARPVPESSRRLPLGRSRFTIFRRKDQVRSPSDDFPFAVAQEPRGTGIPTRDPHLPVHGKNGELARILNDEAQPLLRGGQIGFRPLEILHVRLGPEPLDDPARFIAQRLGARENPAGFAIRADEPVFVAERLPALDGIQKGFARAVAILAMHYLNPALILQLRECFSRVPEHPLVAPGEASLVVGVKEQVRHEIGHGAETRFGDPPIILGLGGGG